MTDATTPNNLHTDISLALKSGRERLIENLGAQNAPQFLDRHTRLFDNYFRQSYKNCRATLRFTTATPPWAIIALGGYGRGEQCVWSDVDLLFLFEKKVPQMAEDLVQEIIYPLWNMGLEVGHATRSIKECLSMAHTNFEVLTSILDARFICGTSPLFSQLTDQLRSKIINRKHHKIISWLVETNRKRHKRFGDSSYLLEPNFKEGHGGLRDYHTMLWIAKIRSRVKRRRDLEYYGYFSHDDYTRLSKALTFIWNLRNRFHLMTNRKSDQIHLSQQQNLADIMKIPAVNGHLPVEQLLGELHGHMEYVKQQHEMFLHELAQKKILKHKSKGLKTTRIKGLKFNQGMLNFISPEKILANPKLLIDIFVESAAQRAPLNSEANRLVQNFEHLMDKNFRNDPLIVLQFEKILVRSGRAFEVLNQMRNTGFLAHFIPEFKAVENRIQFDQYHLYPVDRHLLFTIKILKGFGTAEGARASALSHRLYKELRKKRLLLWAALIHDLGKGDPGPGHSQRGAVLAEKILLEKGASLADSKTVAFLVKHHLILIRTATRRDLNDEETAIGMARIIKKVGLLKMLYLIAVADSMATGPKAWNEWAASLLENLFFKVLKVLEHSEFASGRAVKSMAKKRQSLMDSLAPDIPSARLNMLLNSMSPRYMLYTPIREIHRHLKLFTDLGDHPFVWQIKKSTATKTRTVTICAKDRPGLISKIAGVFTLNSIDILAVEVYTWRNNIAIDVFEVSPPPDPIFENDRWKRTKGDLSKALANHLDLEKELVPQKDDTKPTRSYTAERPTEIVVDNENSSFFTIVEVVTFDFPGLLFLITDALFNCGLDIWVAKIATKADQVVGVYYVRDFEGQKVDAPRQVDTIIAAINKTLPDKDRLHN